MTTAKTPAQRQAAYRARKAADSLSEVRGIFAPTGLHAAIKAAAGRVLKRAAKQQAKEA